MGPIDQAEFLVEFEDVNAEDFHIRSKFIYKIQRYLSSLDEIGTTNSLHNYLPREPSSKGFRAKLKQSSYQQKLDAQRDELAQTRYLNVLSNTETWRISLRFPFTKEMDVGQLQDRIMGAASEALESLIATEEFVAISSPIRLSLIHI